MPFIIFFVAAAIFVMGVIFAVGLYVTIRIARKLYTFMRDRIAQFRAFVSRLLAPRPKRLPVGRTPAVLPAASRTSRAMMH